MTQHLLVDKLKEESDMMKDVDRQIRMLKRCAEKRLEVLKSPTISGICYVRCLDCKDCVAMSRGTQTWSMFEDYDPPLPPHAPVVAVTTPGAKAGIIFEHFSFSRDLSYQLNPEIWLNPLLLVSKGQMDLNSEYLKVKKGYNGEGGMKSLSSQMGTGGG